MSGNRAWQEKCTRALKECIALGAPAGAPAWSSRMEELRAEALATIEPIEQARVIVADCDLRGQSLKSYSFQFCYLARVDFTGADLTGVNFDRAIISDCRLVRADIRGANFDRTKIDTGTLGWHAIWDSTTTLAFTGGTEGLVGFEPSFRFRADDDMRIADLRRRNKNAVLRALYSSLDYGRSLWRLVVLYGILSVLFGGLYWRLAHTGWVSFDAGHWSLFDFILMSAQRFLNASSMFGSGSELAQAIFTLEAALGYGALAVLAAVLLRKFIFFK